MSATPPLFDLETVADLREIDADGETLRAVMRTFLEAAPAQFDDVRAAAASGSLEATSRCAHRLKGGARTIGAEHLAAVCASLELAPEDTSHWLPLLEAALQKTLVKVVEIALARGP